MIPARQRRFPPANRSCAPSATAARAGREGVAHRASIYPSDSFIHARGVPVLRLPPGAFHVLQPERPHTSATATVSLPRDIARWEGPSPRPRPAERAEVRHLPWWRLDVDTGTVLYRNKPGHGGVYCAGCTAARMPWCRRTSRPTTTRQCSTRAQPRLSATAGLSCHLAGGGSNSPKSMLPMERRRPVISAHGVPERGNLTKWPHRFE